MKNLFYRIITGAILLPIVIFAFFSGSIYLLFLLILVGLLTSIEISQMILPKNKIGIFLAFATWAGILSPLLLSSSLGIFLGCLAATLFLFNIFFLFYRSPAQQLYEKLALIFYFCLYVFVGISSLFWLQNYEDKRLGISFILLACIATWSNDIFAYFGGRLFGKRPLFFSVSQKKTWEGLVSGSLGAIITVFLLPQIMMIFAIEPFLGLSPCDLLWILIPSLFLAPAGDLIESRLKRLYEVKDASNILPGHGGLFDRIDGLLLVLPWAFIYAFFIRHLC